MQGHVVVAVETAGDHPPALGLEVYGPFDLGDELTAAFARVREMHPQALVLVAPVKGVPQ